jgi:hypothetical protein
MSRACRNCQWWIESTVPDPVLEGLRSCKGGPPTASYEMLRLWPVTGPDDWCGAFRIAERMAGGVSDAEFEAAGAAMAERLASIGRGTKQ